MNPSVRRAQRSLERSELVNKGEPPINLVPMIDILTVLVLYLLVGTIYKHFTILQLNLPSISNVTQTQEPPPLQLTVTIRATGLELSDRNGALQRLDNQNGRYDLAALSRVLMEIKQRAPQETVINVLLEPDIDYDVLVKVIDTVRLWPKDVVQSLNTSELFPLISIGDAPVVPASTSASTPIPVRGPAS